MGQPGSRHLSFISLIQLLKDQQAVIKPFTTLCFIVVVAMSVPSVQAQDDIFASRFYSSTITPSDGSRLQQVIFYDTEESLIVQSAPLIDLVSRAFDINKYRIVDGPAWIHTPYLYDIKAVPPPVFIQADKEQMLLNLLADRFKLLTEKTSRDLSGYALELDGSKTLVELPAGDGVSGIKIRRFVSSLNKQDLRMEFSMDALADSLSRELNQPVINLTGLSGSYLVDLKGVPTNGYFVQFAPLLELIGLQLEAREMQVDVLAITQIERPAIDDPGTSLQSPDQEN